MFEEIALDAPTRESLIEAFELFDKTAIPKLMSESGSKYLHNRYDDLDENEYVKGLVDAKKRAKFRIKKLESQDSFSKGFIHDIRYSFELIFRLIAEQIQQNEDIEFGKEQMKKFERFKETYNFLYPNTNFDFEALLKGETPYGPDYIQM